MKTTLQSGFTFVELIVAMAILFSLVGFGTASYVNFNERQILEQAGKTLKNNLRSAQQNAIQAVKNDPNGLCGTQQLTGWCVSPQSANPDSDYDIYGACDEDETDINAATYFPDPPDERFKLEEGVTLTARGSYGSSWDTVTTDEEQRIRFNTFGNGVRMENDDPVTPQSYIKMTYCLRTNFPSLGNSAYEIDVLKTGEIQDEGFKTGCFQDSN